MTTAQLLYAVSFRRPRSTCRMRPRARRARLKCRCHTPAPEPSQHVGLLQAAAQHVQNAIQGFAGTPGPSGAAANPLPVTFQKQPFQASAYGQPDNTVSSTPSLDGSSGAGRRLQELPQGLDAGLAATARWLGTAAAAAAGGVTCVKSHKPYPGRLLADGGALLLPVPPQPRGAAGQPGNTQGPQGGPQRGPQGGPQGGPPGANAGMVSDTPPVRQSWADVVQQSTPILAAHAAATNPPAAPQQPLSLTGFPESHPEVPPAPMAVPDKGSGAPPPLGSTVAAVAPAPAGSAGAPTPGTGIAFWLPPVTFQGYKLPALAVPQLPAPAPPPPSRAVTPLDVGGAGRPQSFLQARPQPQQQPPGLPGLDPTSKLVYVGLGGSQATAGR